MRRVVLLAAVLLLVPAAPAAAQLLKLPAIKVSLPAVNIPWERLLPPLATGSGQPVAIPGCADGSIECVRRVEDRLRAQWTALDAACDHRAIAALAYLRITELLREDLERAQPRFIRDKRWMSFVITDFSNSYFEAFERYEQGLPIAEAWQRFYDTATKGQATAIQELLLFSNAHAQHDLPFSYERMGLRTPEGVARKADHDAVNEINVRAIPVVKGEVERRYDPTIPDVPGPLDEMAGLEPTKLWREGAWRNAERLVAAPNRAARDEVAGQIKANAAGWARLIEAIRVPGIRARRAAFCAAFHAGA